ncbi:alpha/beta hydrolase [Streptacidiphilus anmyonensis]|uniref:alpha/beta hydrolase n=1 Tax=Streptacidiphilus anmyonensis TaxID=405782 RepID=UPI0005A7FD35|nr:alpha/beta hydrolase [Streptacidiphilus anmyonensis]
MARTIAVVRTVLNSGFLVAPPLAGRAAFALFRYPLRRGRVRAEEREVHERARTEHLTVNGKSVVVYRWGHGARPVLLLHGWRSRTSRFAALIPPLLALGLSPIGFDAPGHGDSEGRATTILEYRELIGQLHDAYGPFDAIIAHSFGVPAAFLALRGTVKADRLVSVAGVAQFRYLVDGFCTILGLDDGLKADLTRRIERELFPSTESPWQEFDATRRPDDIAVPILAVHDEDDDTVPLDQAHRLQAAYGERLRLLTTTGLGHRRILTEPAVVDNVIGFLTETPSEAVAAEADAEAAAEAAGR